LSILKQQHERVVVEILFNRLSLRFSRSEDRPQQTARELPLGVREPVIRRRRNAWRWRARFEGAVEQTR
jgi:hypothetical protein